MLFSLQPDCVCGSLSVGCSYFVISVNGWHELFKPHSYRCNID